VPAGQTEDGGMLEGIKDAFRHWWLALRCAAIGTYVGMLPGLGAAIVDWVAYGHAVQSAKDKSKFGQGDIRGVIAPEAANNATRGGSLVPTVAFGIPGSLGTAILLGALIIVGLKPGPDMLTTELHITFSMVWTIVIANIVVALLLMVWSKQVAKVAFLPGHLLVPGVILFVFMGAWLGGASLGDWVSCLTMGVVGFVMKRGGWPRPPLVLALILGNIMENSFQISMNAHDGAGWITRPIVLIIMAIIAVTIFFAARNLWQQKKKSETPTQGEGTERNPIISFPFSIILCCLFIWAGFESRQWPEEVSQFPYIAIFPGIAFILFILAFDGAALLSQFRKHGSIGQVMAITSERAVLPGALAFFGYLLAMVVIMLIVGQKFALPLFIFTYLLRWGNYSWKIALGYAAGGWLLLVGFYDQTMHLLWYPAWLSTWLPEILPAWLPQWLFV